MAGDQRSAGQAESRAALNIETGSVIGSMKRPGSKIRARSLMNKAKGRGPMFVPSDAKRRRY
jgi:hypothetical protein